LSDGPLLLAELFMAGRAGRPSGLPVVLTCRSSPKWRGSGRGCVHWRSTKRRCGKRR